MKKLANNEEGQVTSGTHLSFWTDSHKPFSHNQTLSKNLTTDVVIVGGGISGLSVAYCLLRSGKQVVVLEDGFIGSGESGRTTGHLVTALDNRYFCLERIYGEDGARLAAASHAKAIDFIEETITKEKIDCDFERLNGYLFLHPSDDDESMEKEWRAAKKAGLNIEIVSSIPGIKRETGHSMMFPNQAQFHIMKYLKGLCLAIEKKGGHIFTQTHVKTIDEDGVATQDGFTVKAGSVVVATNSPVNNLVATHIKQSSHRTYVIGALVRKGSLPKALWWDTGDHKNDPLVPPYHYVRLQNFDSKYDLLISGGEDHVTGKSDVEEIPEHERYAALEKWTRYFFPIDEIVYRWSGQVMETMDGLAFIGHNPMDKDNIYIVTGDSGNGLTHGTIAGLLISDLINDKKNEWEKLYDPRRFKILSAGETFFKDNISVISEYFKDYPGNADVDELTEIKTGEGKIIEIKGEKFGAYRDNDNHMHIVSAVCTHLQCIVKWNNDELSWDCPCHGSRFTPEGKVINGPANVDLPHYKKEHKHKGTSSNR